MFQCVSSIHMLSLNEEGLTYLKNVDGLIDHLMAVLDTPTNLEATKRMTLLILKRLGCIVASSIVYCEHSSKREHGYFKREEDGSSSTRHSKKSEKKKCPCRDSNTGYHGHNVMY